MMNLKVSTFLGLFFFFAMVFCYKESFAVPKCPNPPCNKTPITGIEILIAGGAALGVRKLMKGKKSNL